MIRIFIILLLVTLLVWNYREPFDGALVQLYAKGPLDTYLSGDAWKHQYYPYYFSPYYPYPSIRHQYYWGNFRPYRYRYRYRYPYVWQKN